MAQLSTAYDASASTLQTIVGRMMDSNAIERLKTANVLETEASVHSMQHVWAREVNKAIRLFI